MARGRGGGRGHCGFSKNISSKKRVKPCFFVTFNISISRTFPENCIEIPQAVQKIWRLSLSIVAIFIDFNQVSGFLAFPCTKKLMLSAYNRWYYRTFSFSTFCTLNRLFNICIKLQYVDFRLVIREIWRGVKLTHQRKKLPSQSPALLGFRRLKNHKLTEEVLQF